MGCGAGRAARVEPNAVVPNGAPAGGAPIVTTVPQDEPTTVLPTGSKAQPSQWVVQSVQGNAHSNDPTEAAKEALHKYSQRQKRTKNRKVKDAGQFLSVTHEVEDDVKYRFTFMVVGTLASQIVEAACNSESAQANQMGLRVSASMRPSVRTAEAARADAACDPPRNPSPVPPLPSSTSETTENLSANGINVNVVEAGAGPDTLTTVQTASNVSPPAASVVPLADQPTKYRCLCEVMRNETREAEEEDSKPELAKLVFKHVSANWNDDLPSCADRLEALQTVLVYVLVLNPSEAAGAAPFDVQLQNLREAVTLFRQRTKAKLRPVRAALLCYVGQDATDTGWVSPLADYESANGYLWKFGPWKLKEGDSWHASFSEMASARIADYRKNNPGDTVAGDGDAEEDTEEPNVQCRRDSKGTENEKTSQTPSFESERSCMSSGSVFSEGWMSPPHFEAERSWSACSNSSENDEQGSPEVPPTR